KAQPTAIMGRGASASRSRSARRMLSAVASASPSSAGTLIQPQRPLMRLAARVAACQSSRPAPLAMDAPSGRLRGREIAWPREDVSEQRRKRSPGRPRELAKSRDPGEAPNEEMHAGSPPPLDQRRPCATPSYQFGGTPEPD